MATLDGIREKTQRSVDPVTGVITESDETAVKGTIVQVAEVKSLNPPLVELLNGEIVEITGRLVGVTVSVGDLILVARIARWFLALGEVEAI